MAESKGVDMKQFTEDGLMEISGLISRREYNRSIVRARQLADRIVRNYATERNIEYTTLADTIERLYARGVINMTSRDNLHTIRIYGNKAVREACDNPDTAESAYALLKNEVETYLSRKQVSVDRTPRRVERPSAGSSYGVSSAGAGGDSAGDGAPSVPRVRRSGSGSSSSGTSSSGSRSRASAGGGERKKESAQITAIDILRILIPIIALILVVIIIRSLLPSKSGTDATTAPQSIEETLDETAEPETEPEAEPETTAAPVLYEISADGVRIRYADDPDRIYTQLTKGTYIGEVTDTDIIISGSSFVQFSMDGKDVIVSKDYITPVEAEE